MKSGSATKWRSMRLNVPRIRLRPTIEFTTLRWASDISSEVIGRRGAARGGGVMMMRQRREPSVEKVYIYIAYLLSSTAVRAREARASERRVRPTLPAQDPQALTKPPRNRESFGTESGANGAPARSLLLLTRSRGPVEILLVLKARFPLHVRGCLRCASTPTSHASVPRPLQVFSPMLSTSSQAGTSLGGLCAKAAAGDSPRLDKLRMHIKSTTHSAADVVRSRRWT